MKYTTEEIQAMADRVEKKLDSYYFDNGADYYSAEEDEDGKYAILDLNLSSKIDQFIEEETEGDELSDEEFRELSEAITNALPPNIEVELESMVTEMLQDQASAQRELEHMRNDNRDFL